MVLPGAQPALQQHVLADAVSLAALQRRNEIGADGALRAQTPQGFDAVKPALVHAQLEVPLLVLTKVKEPRHARLQQARLQQARLHQDCRWRDRRGRLRKCCGNWPSGRRACRARHLQARRQVAVQRHHPVMIRCRQPGHAEILHIGHGNRPVANFNGSQFPGRGAHRDIQPLPRQLAHAQGAPVQIHGQQPRIHADLRTRRRVAEQGERLHRIATPFHVLNAERNCRRGRPRLADRSGSTRRPNGEIRDTRGVALRRQAQRIPARRNIPCPRRLWRHRGSGIKRHQPRWQHRQPSDKRGDFTTLRRMK